MELSDIQTNSCSWGNYGNSTGDASTNSGSGPISGKSEYWKANNIYDLAGNLNEWTQEKWSTEPIIAIRGGLYYGFGDSNPAAFRYHYTESYAGSIGFRVSFYL